MSGNERVRGVQVHRGIIYGSVARLLTPEERALAPPDHTHRWTIFVTSAAPKPGAIAQASSSDPPPLDHIPGGGDDLSYLIKKVTFKLHETIPNPSRNVDKPPFQVTETGWGEFAVPIRIQFVPEAAEKAITITHSIRLHHWGPPIETVAVPAPLPPVVAPAASGNAAGGVGATQGVEGAGGQGVNGDASGSGTAEEQKAGAAGTEEGDAKPDVKDSVDGNVKDGESSDSKDQGKDTKEDGEAKSSEAQDGDDVVMTDSAVQRDQKAASTGPAVATAQPSAETTSTATVPAEASASASAPAAASSSAPQPDTTADAATPTPAPSTSAPTPTPAPAPTATMINDANPNSTPAAEADATPAPTPTPASAPAPAPAPVIHVTPLSIATRYPVHAWQYDELVFTDPYSSFLSILNAHTPTALPGRIKRVRDQREDWEGDKRRKKGAAGGAGGAGAGAGGSRTRGSGAAASSTVTAADGSSTKAIDPSDANPSTSPNANANINLTPASIIAITEKDRLGIPGEPGSADVPLEFTTEMEKAEWNRLNDARIKVIEEMDRWRERLIGKEKEIEVLRKAVGR